MRIDRKITVWTIVLVLAVSLVSAYINLQLHIREEARSFNELGAALGPVLEESVERAMLDKDYTVLEKTLRALEKVESVKRVWLVNNDGIVRAATERNSVGTNLTAPGARCGGCHSAGQQGTYLKKDSMYRWAHPLRNKPRCFKCHDAGSKHNGVFLIDFSVDQSRAIMKREIWGEVTGYLPSIAFAGFGVLILVRTLVIKRVNALDKGIERVAAGDSGVRIPVHGKDELSRLGTGFNIMAETISRSRQELQQYADELLALAVSSSVVSAISRTENGYEAVCRIAVKELKMKMAWMGAIREGGVVVEPVAQYGFDAGYLKTVRVPLDDSSAGRGFTGMAVKTMIPQVMNDMESDSVDAPWREEAMKRGARSSLALPLFSSDGHVISVLNLYSGDPGYFTGKRVRLFVIFGNQVAAAIENHQLIENAERRSEEIAEQLRLISRSQQEWQLTFDSIKDLVSIHDKDFRIIKANRAFVEYMGLRSEEILNRTCYKIFHDTCSPLAGCPHRKSMAEKRVVVEENVDPRTNRTFQVTVFPYHSPEGEYIGSVHIARDITDTKEKEMRLIMSERLAALGQMASGIAHEINNPLASIAGCAEGLLMKVKHNKYDPHLFEEYLNIIEEEIKRCKSITTGMLSFVRKTAYEKKQTDINELLDKTIEIIGFQGRLQDVTIVKHYQADLPMLCASEGEIRQVFLALITNALDAMNNSGTLTITTATEDGSLFVSLADTGCGISEDFQNRIFDPFFTTKTETGGTGLGLSIAHKIVTNHEGTIAVSSEERKGSEFILTFPLTEDRA